MKRAAIAVATLLLVAYVLLRHHPEPVTTLARAAVPAVAPAVAAAPAAAPTAAPAVVPTVAELRAALTDLDRARAAAYADPVTADPDVWAARTCPCHAEDSRRLRTLAARGHRLRGQRTTLVSVTVARAGPESADLVVSDTTSAYTAVDARGRVVARWRATSLQWQVTLVRVSGRWLLGAVARAP